MIDLSFSLGPVPLHCPDSSSDFQRHVLIAGPIITGLVPCNINMFKGKGSSYELAGNLNLVTPFDPLSMPYNRQGKTTFR